jgi:hypothetical protein
VERGGLGLYPRHQSPGAPHLLVFREMWDTTGPTLKPAGGRTNPLLEKPSSQKRDLATW